MEEKKKPKSKKPSYAHYVVIKFHDDVELPRLGNIVSDAAKYGIKGLSELFKQFPDCEVRPLITSLKEEQLMVLTKKAEKRHGRKIKNLNLFYRITCGSSINLAELVETLRKRPEIEKAYIEAPASEPANGDPSVNNYEPQQGYLDPAPTGINARFAWTLAGGRGDGINVVDCEQGWVLNHEDIDALGATLIFGADRTTSHDHGTAVIGELAGENNGFGVTGIASNVASLRVTSHYAADGTSGHVADAIVAALILLVPGDVLLLEIQRDVAGAYPTEIDDADFTAIQLAVALGVVVVEAAGNGGNNLDNYTDASGNFILTRTVRDSGAIIVGAGASADHSRLGLSNYGSRVDCQGWGENVVTLGYGDLENGGTEQTEYTNTFGGTSSASPIVAGAALCIQGIAEASIGHRLSPAQIRNLLSTFGTPQGGVTAATEPIGVLPDLAQIIPQLGLLPDIYLRDNVSDTGDVPVVGGISASPDIILRKNIEPNPETAFGPATINNADLGDEVEIGHDNYIYVRLQNRGAVAADATVSIYWSEVAALVMPSSWHYIGDINVPNVIPGALTIGTTPLTWVQIPAEGHYCLIGVVNTPLDPAPPIGGFDDLNKFYNFIRNNNNVTWRNFNVVPVDPNSETTALNFEIRGGDKMAAYMNVEVIRQLPPKAKILWNLPKALIDRVPLNSKRIEWDKKNKMAQLVVGSKGMNKLHQILLPQGARYKSRLKVQFPKDTLPGNYSLAVRQVYRGKELGRVTWLLKVGDKVGKQE